jgi:PTS system mannose-specific IIC component
MANASGAAGTPALWTLGILLFAPMGPLGAMLEKRLDQRAARYQTRAISSASSGQLDRAARQNLRAMWPHFVFFGLLSSAAWLVGRVLGAIEPSLPLSALRGLAWAYPALCSVAAAAAVRGSRARAAPQLAIGAAALVTVVAAMVALWGPP